MGCACAAAKKKVPFFFFFTCSWDVVEISLCMYMYVQYKDEDYLCFMYQIKAKKLHLPPKKCSDLINIKRRLASR